MTLPEQFSSMEGKIAGEGTIVYNSEESNVAAAVQGIQEEQDGVSCNGFRGLVIIENTEAPHEYSFDFNLPDGCKLMTSEEYNGNSSDAGYIYIVNVNNMLIDEESGEEFYDIIGSIAPAWAKDANGIDVETRYSLNGNTITQVVEFDEHSAFPIVADPSASKKPASKKVDSGTATIKVNLAELGGVSLFATTGKRTLTAAAKRKIMSAAAKKVASKFVPVLGNVSFAASVASYAAYKAGYKYLKMTIRFEKWTNYKSQGGRWVKGYVYKNCSLKCSVYK